MAVHGPLDQMGGKEEKKKEKKREKKKKRGKNGKVKEENTTLDNVFIIFVLDLLAKSVFGLTLDIMVVIWKR